MNTPTKPKFCKDCAHFSQHTVHPPKCKAPEATNSDAVFGERSMTCFDARQLKTVCGSEARLFTTKKAKATWLARFFFSNGSQLP